jgi:hypothetical protein
VALRVSFSEGTSTKHVTVVWWETSASSRLMMLCRLELAMGAVEEVTEAPGGALVPLISQWTVGSGWPPTERHRKVVWLASGGSSLWTEGGVKLAGVARFGL